MKKCLCLLSLALVWMASGCAQGSPAATTARPPTSTPTEAVTSTVAATSTVVATPTASATAAVVATPTVVATSTQAVATEPTPAELPALLAHLHWLGHASFRFDGPPTIYFDPTSLGGEVIPADIILISHEHNDHYAPSVLEQISTSGTVIITNPDLAGRVETAGIGGKVQALKPGERTTVGEVEIEAVPAYNLTKSYHPKANGWLGFIITWNGERLYFAGDTDRIPEMADIECDVALLPVGGTYTMNVQEAAQAAADIGPRVAVPMHDRGANLEEFRTLCDCTVVILEQ